MNEQDVKVGLILAIDNGPGTRIEYWKVVDSTARVDSYSKEPRFLCIKCTSTGLEYSYRTTFGLKFIAKWATDKICLTGVKVSTAGAEIGAKKRRISHLEKSIAKMQHELTALKLAVANS